MLSEDILTDEKFNALSLEAQNLFLRMLAKADDCGVVPANDYTLAALTNPPAKVRKNLAGFVAEIVTAGLGRVIEHQGKQFFTFKPDSFLAHQGHILNKRTRSEYLKMTADEYDSGSFREVLGNSGVNDADASSGVESREQKVESSKSKAERNAKRIFVVPTVEEVVAYCEENGYPASLGVKAHKHYDLAEWHDTHGHPVKNWKQKLHTVWFKPENQNDERSGSDQGRNPQGGGKHQILPGSIERTARAGAAYAAARAQGGSRNGT